MSLGKSRIIENILFFYFLPFVLWDGTDQGQVFLLCNTFEELIFVAKIEH